MYSEHLFNFHLLTKGEDTNFETCERIIRYAMEQYSEVS